jgi:hypothetical protein
MKSKPKAIQGWTSIYKKKPNSYFPSLITSHFIKSTLYKIVGTKITCTSWINISFTVTNCLEILWSTTIHYTWFLLVGFITTYVISAYQHGRCEFQSFSGKVYSIQHYVIKFVCDLRQSPSWVRCSNPRLFSGRSLRRILSWLLYYMMVTGSSYSIPVWDPYLQKDKNKIEMVQRSSTIRYKQVP